MKKERGILGKRIGSKHTVREPEGSIKQLSFQTSGPATSPAAEARRQPPRRTATDAKRKIEDGEAAAYERMSDKDYDTHFLRVAVGKGKASRSE